mmetsp:Transcript_12476/g.20972  ORF Transcript_12476/g.20972 Transcript_12476/m.20972 type:complete len:105 (+) Transcript_12476:675-989(+)
MVKQKKAVEKQVKQVKKMTEFETFLALIKGYCGSVILFCPKAFANGGYFYSSFTLWVSCLFTTVCALKLIECGQRYNCYSYSLIVKKAFGKKGRLMLDLMIAFS